MNRKGAALWAGFLLSIVAAGAARGQELCVRCSEPSATYRCAVDASAGPTANASTPGLQLLCITELARQGGHAICAVERTASGACDGILRVVAPTAAMPLGEGIAKGGEGAGKPPGADAGPPRAAGISPGGDPPRTVEEMVEKSQIAQKTGLQQAGKTIAKTADAAGEVVTGTAKAAGDVVTGTAKTAGGAVGKAGSAVGNAAKKSWDCLTSLFKDC